MSITTYSEYNSVQSKKGKITKFYIYLTGGEDEIYTREWRGCGGYCCDGYCMDREWRYETTRTWRGRARQERGRVRARGERRERGRRWATSGGRGGGRGGVFF